MRNENLDRVLRAVHEKGVRDAPEHHRLWTPECPSIPHFVVAMENGSWTIEEREHMKECPYCEFLGAIDERSRKQTGKPTVRNLFKQAMGRHRDMSEWTEDEVLELAYDESHLRAWQEHDYVEGKLGEGSRRVVESHVARCEYCAASLAALTEITSPANHDPSD